MALIAGSNLSDLSRNSLVADSQRQAASENALNRARRAYEYGTLSAQDRERTNQLMADLAMRRELGMGDIGVRNRAVDVNREVGLSDIGVREKVGMGQIETQNKMLDWQKEWMKSGGDTRAPAMMAANRANQLLQLEKQGARGELVNRLDTPMTFRSNAIKVADDIIAGRPVPSWAEKAKQWYEYERMPQARQRILGELGDAAGVVMPSVDPLGNELYVPTVGRSATEASSPVAQPAAVNNLAPSAPQSVPRVRFVRGPDGNFVRDGASVEVPAPKPVAARVAPVARQSVGPGLSAWTEAITGYSPSDIGGALTSGISDISKFWTGYTPPEMVDAASNNLAGSYIGAYDAAANAARSARDAIVPRVRQANPFLPDFWMENNAQPTQPSRPVNWFGMGGY